MSNSTKNIEMSKAVLTIRPGDYVRLPPEHCALSLNWDSYYYVVKITLRDNGQYLIIGITPEQGVGHTYDHVTQNTSDRQDMLKYMANNKLDHTFAFIFLDQDTVQGIKGYRSHVSSQT